MKFKKILSLLTAAAMTLSLGITSVSADTTEEAGSAVAKIGETGYTSLAAAFANAQDGETVTVIADTSIAGNPVEYRAKSVTLDLNDHTVTAENKESGNIAIFEGATLTLKDTVGGGSIVSNTKYDGTNNTTKPVINVDNGSTFTMQSGTIETVYGTTAKDAENYGQYGVGVWKNSSATINGGTIKSGWYCVASNGSKDKTGAYVGDKANITVNGGKLISTADYAIYAPSVNGTVTIAGGEVVGATGAVAMRAGDLIVNGGTLGTDKTSSTGTWADGTGNIGNAVIALASGSETAYGSINARIHGGEIKLLNGAEDPLFIINKGDKDLKFTIDGGAFSEDISKGYKDYIADGYEVVSESKLYKVYPYAEVLMNYKRYATIQDAQDAIDALPDNRDVSIYVRGDIKVNTPITIKNKKAVSINLNGNSITATGDKDVFSVDSCKSLTIFNGSSAETTGAVAANGGKCVSVTGTAGVTIKDVNFTQEKADSDLIYADGTTVVTIKSGSYKAVTPEKTLVKNGDSAKFKVTGGTFYQYDPTAFVNTKTYYVGSDGEYFTVVSTPVAENTATGVKYATLSDAVKAVEAGQTATINLIADISSGWGAAMVTDNKDITINLNGYTIRASKVNSGVFVVGDAKLTIEGEGTVTALQNGGALAFDVLANATVNIKGGNFSQVISNDDGSGHYDFIYIEGNNSTVNISGGTFTAFTPKWTLNKFDSVTGSTFNVTGGKFYNYNPAAAETEPTKPTSFVPGGYDVAQDSDGYYTVSPTAANVAKIGEVEYPTLQSAVTNAANGDTITLISDVNTKTYAAMIGGKTLTINLNGHNITSGNAAIYAYDKANVTIDGDGTVTAFPPSYTADQVFAIAVWANNATVNINDGTYTQKIENVNPTEDDFALIYSYGGGVINIKGGTFKPLTPKWTLNLQDNTGSTISVSGGKFYNYNPAAAKTEPTKPTSFVADGCVATADANGDYTVAKREENFGKVAVMTHGKGQLTLLSGINFLDYRNAGFIVDFGGGNTKTVDTTVVYENVTAGGDTKTAEDFGTKYIFGAEITLPDTFKTGAHTLTITPFANVLNKSEQIKAAAETKVNISNTDATVSE